AHSRGVLLGCAGPWSPVPLAASSAGIVSQPASGHSSNHLDPRALRSGRVVMSLSSPLPRPDPPDPPTPPPLPQPSLHACHPLYAGRSGRSISPLSPCPHRLPQQSSESAPPTSLHR